MYKIYREYDHMHEIRNCTICPTGEFRCKTTSKRKTCCTECSRKYIAEYRKKFHDSYNELKRKSQKLEKMFWKQPDLLIDKVELLTQWTILNSKWI